MALSHSGDRFPVLDGLRSISIILVLACHLLPLGPKILRLNETAGAMGMSLFFALSGFLITSALMRNPKVLDFMVRRLARILPLAYAYTLVVFLIFSFDPKAMLWTDLFMVNYLTQYLTGWNDHFWSLCVEMQFYLVIASVVFIVGRKGLWIVWLACLTVTLFRVHAGAYIAIETHLRVDEILTGAFVATVYPTRTSLNRSFALMIVAAMLWAVSAWPLAGALQYFRPYTTALLLLAALHHGATNPTTFLTSRFMSYIASISYALYVIHPATAYGWMNEGTTMTRYLLKRPISLALTFLLAHLSTFYWESWWQSAARRWLQKRHLLSSAGSATAPRPRWTK